MACAAVARLMMPDPRYMATRPVALPAMNAPELNPRTVKTRICDTLRLPPVPTAYLPRIWCSPPKAAGPAARATEAVPTPPLCLLLLTNAPRDVSPICPAGGRSTSRGREMARYSPQPVQDLPFLRSHGIWSPHRSG